MNIDIYVLCKNEVKLAPFYNDYWKSLADKINVYVFDGGSVDGTREYLSQFDYVHIIDFEPDALDDFNHIELKNNCWKQSRGKADFVMVCDFDETIFSYSAQELKTELIMMKEGGYSILAPLSYNLVGKEFPKYEEHRFLHEIVGMGFNDFIYEAKPILFDPNKISEINYVLGAHCASPQGDVKWYNSNKLFLIHSKFISLDYYLERLHLRKLSQKNIAAGLMGELDKTEEMLLNEYNRNLNKSFAWNSIKENFNKYYNIWHDWSYWKGNKMMN